MAGHMGVEVEHLRSVQAHLTKLIDELEALKAADAHWEHLPVSVKTSEWKRKDERLIRIEVHAFLPIDKAGRKFFEPKT